MEQKVESILKKLTLLHIATIFFIVAIIVYGNMLPNSFIADDKGYIINNLGTHIISLPAWFGPNDFNVAGQYRPLQPAYFSILYALFRDAPFLYHFIQIALHVVETTLLYVLFRKFIPLSVSLVIALVFLLHPMNVESVSFIAQAASPNLFILGLVPFLIITKKSSLKKDLIIFSLLLLSLFIKETGVVFIFLLPLYYYLFVSNNKNVAKYLIGSLIVLVLYAFIRIYIGQVGIVSRSLVPIANLSLVERLANVPAIIYYYLKTFFFPNVLAYDQQWTISSVKVSTFYLPLIIDLSFLVIFGLVCLRLFKKQRQSAKPFLFFSTWFILGMLPTIQIFPLDMTVGDRWFYIPMVGLLGMLGLLYHEFVNKLPKYWILALLLSIIVIASLALRTIVRNGNWQNGIALYTHDIQVDDNYDIENNLGVEYLSVQQYVKALGHFRKSVSKRPFEVNLNNLGLAYEHLGDVKQAKKYYASSFKVNKYYLFLNHKHDIHSYNSYASFLVFYDEPSMAIPFIQSALLDYPDSASLWFYLALAKYKSHDIEGAMDAASKAYAISPNEQNVFIYNNIKNNASFTINYENKVFSFSSE